MGIYLTAESDGTFGRNDRPPLARNSSKTFQHSRGSRVSGYTRSSSWKIGPARRMPPVEAVSVVQLVALRYSAGIPGSLMIGMPLRLISMCQWSSDQPKLHAVTEVLQVINLTEDAGH
jgi:hypothetical protein